MKRGIILSIVAVLLIVLLVIAFVVINSKQMISGSASDLDKVVVNVPDYVSGGVNQKQIILETSEQLDEIFNILANTSEVRFLKFYKHESDEWFQHDRKFRIQLYYSSGKIETIEATERKGGIFRDKKILFVKGFLIGKNERLWEHVENL